MCVCVCVCVHVCVCVCVCVCVRVCVCVCCTFQIYLNPDVIAIVIETEGGEKCQFEMCMLTDTQHSLMHVLISYFSVS